MMEVDNNQDDGTTAGASPPGDAVNGDDSLDYTITMNESDDESSNNSAPSLPNTKKSTDAPAPSVEVNGKSTSDDDTGSSASAQPEADASKSSPDADTSKTSPEAVASKTSPEDSNQSVDKEAADDVVPKSDQNDTVKDKSKEQSKESSDVESKTGKDMKNKGGKGENPNEKEKDTEVVVVAESPAKQSALDGKRNTTATVEVDDPSVKSSGKGSVKSKTKNPAHVDIGSNLASIFVDTRKGGGIPLITSASSLLSSTSVQLMLSSAAQAIQGSSLMYVPNNTILSSASSTTPMFFPTGANPLQNQTLARSVAPLILPQYAKMLANQSNRFMPPKSQTARPTANVSNAASVLANIPEKPTSSKGMIDMIRWELDNHINVKAKYVKPNPKAELGNLSKWVFDLGSDIVKEYVYHDLVKIQHRRKDEGSLSAKEKDDFAKLQEIDKELNKKVGHLKYKQTKSCKCGFKTELKNVMYHHTQHAHIERGGFLNCGLCKFCTRQPHAFRFHMETEHGRLGKVDSRPSFYECPLCPYETNYTNRLDQHKVRCQRQFRENFNLHPSCVTGPEVSLCLENVFYYVFTRQFMNTIIPKTLTPAVSSSMKIRDMPTNQGAPVITAQTKRVHGNAVTTLSSSTKQITPNIPVQNQLRGVKNAPNRPTAQPNTLSRNFPVISSKINTAVKQAFSSFPPRAPVRGTSLIDQTASMKQLAAAQNQAAHRNQPAGANQPNNGFEVCEICGGYVKDRKALRIHFFYAHRIDMPFGVFERPQPPLYCATCFCRFWTAQGLQKHIEIHKNDMVNASQANNGVAGKCISCGHRVPNILMHMQMVHNREMRHYLAALMCIFCGNKFETKKDVENHIGKIHGVVVRSSKPPPAKGNPGYPAVPGNAKGNVPNAKGNMPNAKPPVNAGASKQSSGGKLNKGSQCVLCNVTFTRNVDLTRHCMRVHHTCMKCGLVVVDKESLSRHTCLHSASGMRSCQICKETGFHPAYYIKHMRDKHLRKCSIVLRRIDRAVVESMKRPITISDSEDDESLPDEKQQSKRRKVDDDDKGKSSEVVGSGSEKVETPQSNSGETATDEGDSIKTEKAENVEEKSGSQTEEQVKSGDEADKSCETKDVDSSGESGKADDKDKSLEKKESCSKSDNASDGSVNQDVDGDDDDTKATNKDQTEDKNTADETKDSESGNTRTSECESNAKRKLRSQSSEEQSENDSFEKCVPSKDENSEISGQPQSSDFDSETKRKRKPDKDDSEEEAPVRKSLRRSGSKGGDSMDLD